MRELIVFHLLEALLPMLCPRTTPQTVFSIIVATSLPTLAFINLLLFHEVFLIRLKTNIILTSLCNNHLYQLLQ
jgi:hypothetical protein